MNPRTRDHGAEINSWMLRTCSGLSLEQQTLFFEKTLNDLLKRIAPTLGDIVLTSLLDRILYDSGERFPFLSTLQVDPSFPVIDFTAFKKDSTHVQQEEFMAAFSTIFAALFLLIDRLTGDVLTPAMYAHLLNKPTQGSL